MDRKERPSLYDYVQKRIKEKVEEDKYLGLILNDQESNELKEAVRKEKERLEAAEKMKEEALLAAQVIKQ